MVVKTITEAKNSLSALIDQVRAGESVLIVDRGAPVARLESAAVGGDDDDGRLARLERAGLIRRGSGHVPQEILDGPTVSVAGATVSEALTEERRTGR